MVGPCAADVASHLTALPTALRQRREMLLQGSARDPVGTAKSPDDRAKCERLERRCAGPPRVATPRPIT